MVDVLEPQQAARTTREVESSVLSTSEEFFRGAWHVSAQVSAGSAPVHREALEQALAELIGALEDFNDYKWFALAALAATRSLANHGAESLAEAQQDGRYAQALDWAFAELAQPHMLRLRSVKAVIEDAATRPASALQGDLTAPTEINALVDWLSDRLVHALPLLERQIAAQQDRIDVMQRLKLVGSTTRIQKAIDQLKQLRDALKHEQAARARLEALQR